MTVENDKKTDDKMTKYKNIIQKILMKYEGGITIMNVINLTD